MDNVTGIDLEKNLINILKNLEEERLFFLKKFNVRKKIITTICTIIFTVTLLIMNIEIAFIPYSLKEFVNEQWLGIFLLVGIISLWWVLIPVEKYKNEYKNKTISRLLNIFGKFEYIAKGKIEQKKALLSGFHFLAGMWETEDFIKGEHKGIDLEFCELKVTRTTGRSNYTVFKGAIILLKMPKQFECDIYIGKDYGKFINGVHSTGTKNKKRINLVDPIFEDRYQTYATDQTIGRYIINPAFMEKFMALDDIFKEKAKGSSIEASFYGDNLLLKLGYEKNLFEAPDINKEATETIEDIELMYKEIELILGIIEALSLEKFAKNKE